MGVIKVMIVDDYVPVRRTLVEVLRLEENIEIVGEAGDGEEAIVKVRELSPDVVLMDIRMPRLDGLEAARYIKKHFPAVKVIMLSAYNEKQMVNRALKLGANGYVTKDKSVEEIVELVHKVCGQ